MDSSSLSTTWLRDVLAESLRASEASPLSQESGPPQQRDPHFRKIVEGIIYSQKLILTYHLSVVGLVMLLSMIHWSRMAMKWNQKRRALERRRSSRGGNTVNDTSSAYADGTVPGRRCGQDEVSSGSVRPLFGFLVSHEKREIFEDTPLLRPHTGSRRTIPLVSVSCWVRSFLIYQPRPIPIVGKILPSNGQSLAVGLLIALNVFYTVYGIHFNLFEVFVFADRCGLVFAANLPLLYFMAAKTQPLKLLTGYSYESLNIFHRRLGELLCLEALIHSAGMFVVWYTLLRPAGSSLVQFLLHPVILLGAGALVAYETLYLTSLGSVRQRFYELFLATHVLLQASALALLFFHHRRSRTYVGVAMAIFLLDRLVSRALLKTTTVDARAAVLEDGETVRLSAEFPLHQQSDSFSPLGLLQLLLTGGSVRSGWRASDHVLVSVPSLGKLHALQAHPFTIASPAPSSLRRGSSSIDAPADEEHIARLDLLIRARDGFTAELLRAAVAHKTLTLRLDGPYGGSHAREMLRGSEVAIVVAGGSGIAVAWPLVYSLLDESDSDDDNDDNDDSNCSSSPFASRSPSNRHPHCCRRSLNDAELARPSCRCLPSRVSDNSSNSGGEGLVVRGAEERGLAGEGERRRRRRMVRAKKAVILIWVIQKSSHLSWVGRPALGRLEERGVTINVPRATEEIGRPDLDAIVAEHVAEHGGTGTRRQRKVGIVASGPDSMGRRVRNMGARMVRDGGDVAVAVEKFGW